MTERFAGRNGCIKSNGISVSIKDWVIFRGSRAPNALDWKGRATIDESIFAFSGLMEGTFEMAGKTYYGDIEIVKMFRKNH